VTTPSRIDGSVAVVTGGAGDIGLAIGSALADQGATVILADVDEARAQEHAITLRESGGHVGVLQVNLSDANAAGDMVHRVVSEYGSLHTLVNAAAVTARGRIYDLPEDAWDRLLAVNLSSVFWTCREAIKHMIDADGGVIINIGSVAGVRGLPGSPAYAATKGGVVALSRALAIDHAADGIRVYSVNPPAVDTRLYRASFRSEGDPEGSRHRFAASEGAGRVLTTDEVAALVIFLAEGRGPVFSPEPLVW
jgi:NAD(P)-dependent dehydrogenase (short-subunit alcohol dehydrogenase family)